MTDTTTRPESSRRLTGCPWPTGIHRFVLGVCTRCGTDDLNPVSNRGGFTDADDLPIPYTPTDEAEWADAWRSGPGLVAVGVGSPDVSRDVRVVAQVAVEYIINHSGDGFDPATMRTVLDQAIAVGVADLYVAGLQDLVDAL